MINPQLVANKIQCKVDDKLFLVTRMDILKYIPKELLYYSINNMLLIQIERSFQRVLQYN